MEPEILELYHEMINSSAFYVVSFPPWTEVTLDGDFTTEQLEAIFTILRHHNENNISKEQGLF